MTPTTLLASRRTRALVPFLATRRLGVWTVTTAQGTGTHRTFRGAYVRAT